MSGDPLTIAAAAAREAQQATERAQEAARKAETVQRDAQEMARAISDELRALGLKLTEAITDMKSIGRLEMELREAKAERVANEQRIRELERERDRLGGEWGVRNKAQERTTDVVTKVGIYLVCVLLASGLAAGGWAYWQVVSMMAGGS